MSSLIFNADDFGRSHAENLCILRAISAGLVRSTTVMANMPAAHDISHVRCEQPDLGVGVHLNLTEGRPLLPPHAVPSLITPAGTFWPKRQLLWRSCLGLVRPHEVTAELRAQILQVKAWVGETTHADFHQNALIFPCILPAALEGLRSLGIVKIRTQRALPLPRAQRSDQAGLAHRPPRYGPAVAQSIWTAVKRLRGKHIQHQGFRGTAYLLVGAPGYKDERISIAWLLGWWNQMLPRLPDSVVEVPLHPGVSPAEVAVLTDRGMKRLLEACQVHVLSYAEL